MQFITLEIVHENASALADNQKTDPTAFALIRRDGFGASDAASLLNVSPWTPLAKLIEQKASTEVTEDELKVGLMPNVRKGTDLEPLILQKFIDWSGVKVEKPEAMFRIKNFPQLTVNFDGIIDAPDEPYHGRPVECKMVSMFAEKYWDHSKAMSSMEQYPIHVPIDESAMRVTPDAIGKLALACGIPIYYYTQCQQQLLATNTTVCYLAALHDKDWTLRVYRVPRCEPVIAQLKEAAYLAWKKVENKKERA